MSDVTREGKTVKVTLYDPIEQLRGISKLLAERNDCELSLKIDAAVTHLQAVAAPSVSRETSTGQDERFNYPRVPIPEPKNYYKCFGCKQVFVDEESAEKHFGKPKEREFPVCYDDSEAAPLSGEGGERNVPRCPKCSDRRLLFIEDVEDRRWIQCPCGYRLEVYVGNVDWMALFFPAVAAQGQKDQTGPELEILENHYEWCLRTNVTTCGFNTSGLALEEIGGCGQEVRDADIYRCADCGTPFHRQCIKKHFSVHGVGGSPARSAPEKSLTYGDLPGCIRNMVESHEWDNKNISEQRDCALDMVEFLERELGNFRRNQAAATKVCIGCGKPHEQLTVVGPRLRHDPAMGRPLRTGDSKHRPDATRRLRSNDAGGAV